MKPFQKILVPTDFSAPAEEATRFAAALSRRLEAPLTLVYVYEPVTYALPDSYVLFTAPQLDRMFAEFEGALAAARERALAAGATTVDTKVLSGFAAGEITALARRGGFDLIVMGTHGRTGLSHVVIGSVAERVVRTADCPVLTVRQTKPA
jgi:nucleotide-binding universal stress UspA family protein